MWPKIGDGNDVALVDVVNRGSDDGVPAESDGWANLVGDGFLMKQGFMIICIGWEFDVAGAKRRHPHRRARGDRERRADHRHRAGSLHA